MSLKVKSTTITGHILMYTILKQELDRSDHTPSNAMVHCMQYRYYHAGAKVWNLKLKVLKQKPFPRIQLSWILSNWPFENINHMQGWMSILSSKQLTII